MSFPVVTLSPGSDRRVRRGHCWIYSNEIRSVHIDGIEEALTALNVGQVATVVNASKHVIGSAYFNPHALLCGRLFSREADKSFEELLRERVIHAYQWREQHISDGCYRLIYGDGDKLPGLVVDRFGDYLVLQATTFGVFNMLEKIVEVLVDVVLPKGILLRNDADIESEQLPAETRVIYGEVPDVCEVIEGGVAFLVPVKDGQKTGWFFDHRDSREYLRRFASGASVLDVYSYLGSWGLQAMDAGAEKLVAIDRSELALSLLQENVKRYPWADRVSVIKGMATHELKRLAGLGEQFDVVVLDPPAFIQRRKDLRSGEKAYHQINQRAIKLIKPGGLLVSASCSMHLSLEVLLEMVKIAAHKMGRTATFVHIGGLGLDHPVPATMPETNYLKTVFARID